LKTFSFYFNANSVKFLKSFDFSVIWLWNSKWFTNYF